MRYFGWKRLKKRRYKLLFIWWVYDWMGWYLVGCYWLEWLAGWSLVAGLLVPVGWLVLSWLQVCRFRMISRRFDGWQVPGWLLVCRTGWSVGAGLDGSRLVSGLSCWLVGSVQIRWLVEYGQFQFVVIQATGFIVRAVVYNKYYTTLVSMKIVLQFTTNYFMRGEYLRK